MNIADEQPATQGQLRALQLDIQDLQKRFGDMQAAISEHQRSVESAGDLLTSYAQAVARGSTILKRYRLISERTTIDKTANKCV